MTTPSVELRRAQREDLAWCRRFDRWTQEERLLRKIYAGEVLIGSEGPEDLGYVRLGYLWAWHPFIELIVVDERARGRGVGTAMLRGLEDRLRAEGARVLFSSSQANEPAPQRWHRRAGFRETGTLHGANWDGSDEIFFRKEL